MFWCSDSHNDWYCVLSMLSEALHFFRFVSPADFSLAQNGIQVLARQVMQREVTVSCH